MRKYKNEDDFCPVCGSVPDDSIQDIILDKLKREDIEERLTTLTGIELIMLENLIDQHLKGIKNVVTRSRWGEILYKLGGE